MSIYPPVRDEMIRLLSVPRLATYTAACDGDVKRALELYRWNLTVSTAFFESIHYFEVAFRNCVDGAVAAWVATGEPEVTSWFDDSTVPLSEGAWRQVQQAKERIVDAGQVVAHGRIVAELSLGFWEALLSDRYNRTIWATCLKDAFPGTRRQRLHDAVDQIRRLRNRIAHHEPLISRDLESDYELLLGTAERISPRLAWWIDATSRLADVLPERPMAR